MKSIETTKYTLKLFRRENPLKLTKKNLIGITLKKKKTNVNVTYVLYNDQDLLCYRNCKYNR